MCTAQCKKREIHNSYWKNISWSQLFWYILLYPLVKPLSFTFTIFSPKVWEWISIISTLLLFMYASLVKNHKSTCFRFLLSNHKRQILIISFHMHIANWRKKNYSALPFFMQDGLSTFFCHFSSTFMLWCNVGNSTWIKLQLSHLVCWRFHLKMRTSFDGLEKEKK